MATADSVKAKLQGLIDAANAVTGTADTDMTAAVNNLISGFGGGGIDIKSMTVTPAEAVSTVTLPELIGKQNVILIPRFIPAANMVSSGRIAGFGLYFQGAFYIHTRTQSSNTTWGAAAIAAPYGSSQNTYGYFTFDPETGEIGGGIAPANGQMVAQPYEIFYW